MGGAATSSKASSRESVLTYYRAVEGPSLRLQHWDLRTKRSRRTKEASREPSAEFSTWVNREGPSTKRLDPLEYWLYLPCSTQGVMKVIL